ncbi:MAG: Holliday junction resolvase YqgF [Firmicutes bacterium]|nr:Holliday junction resolvase YqgF [Bacillota bacterium]
MNPIIIAIDPGREKCGIAVVHKNEGVLTQQVINTTELNSVIQRLGTDYETSTVVIGDRTSSKEARQNLEQMKIAGQLLTITLVDEHRSTDQARLRYWQANPPKGFKRLIPVTMQVPPRPIDDYVAVILAERYFNKQGI